MRFLLALIFIFCASLSLSATGSMICKVKSNYIVNVEDGVTKSYAGYSDGVELNDSVILTYTVTPTGNFAINLKAPSGRYISRYRELYLEVNPSDPSFETLSLGATTFGGANSSVSQSGLMSAKISASEDSLYFEDIVKSGRFERYYKNDWQGLFQNQRGFETQIATFNCRHNQNGLQEFIKSMNSSGNF